MGGLQRADVVRGLAVPGSVAIVGDTPGPGPGGLIHERLLEVGYPGRILPVNPKHGSIRGERSYPSLAAVDGPVDFVAVALGADRAVATVREAIARGARGVLVIGGGFAEAGPEGKRRQRELRAMAVLNGVPVIGPNCYGIVNVRDRFAAYFGALAKPLRPGPVSLIFQSGALTHAAMDPVIGRMPGYGHIITTGNEAVLDFADYLDYVLSDRHTRAIGCYVETIRRPARFVAAARRAAGLGVRLVILKVGRSEAARRAALAHTGALTGEDRIWDTILRDLGVIRVDDIDSMNEALALAAAVPGPLRGGAVVMSISGGGSGIVADIAQSVGARLAPLTQDTRDRLSAVLPSFARAHNPLDVTGAVVQDPTIVARAIEAVDGDPGVGVIAFGLNNSRASDPAERGLYRTLARTVAGTRHDTPLVLLTMSSGAHDPVIARLASRARVPLLHGAREALTAIAFLQEARIVDQPGPRAPSQGERRLRSLVRAAPPGVLDAAVARAIIVEAGIPQPRSVLATSVQAAVGAAVEIGFPVVVKVASRDVPHRSEVGGVRVGLADADAVRAGYADVLASVRSRRPGARVQGVEVQQHVEEGVEVLVGLTIVRGLPPLVVLGAGGTLVELQGDVRTATAPLTRERARRLVADSAIGRVLGGYRGRPRADIEALVEALVGFARLGWVLRNELRELEVNPLMVLPAGQGLAAVDVLGTRA